MSPFTSHSFSHAKTISMALCCKQTQEPCNGPGIYLRFPPSLSHIPTLLHMQNNIHMQFFYNTILLNGDGSNLIPKEHTNIQL